MKNTTLPTTPSPQSPLLSVAPKIQRNISLKLVDPPVDELRETMRVFGAASQYISHRIKSGDPLSRTQLHKLHYATLRNHYGLMSQMAQSVLRAVIGAYRAMKSNGHSGAAPSFNTPLLRLHYNRDWAFTRGKASIRTLRARRRIAFTAGDFQRTYLDDPAWIPKGACVVEKKGTFFLNVTLEGTAPLKHIPITPIGVDLGVRSLAVARAPDAKPLIIRGGLLRNYREMQSRTRKRLQSKSTRSARRVLKQIGRRENRHILDFCRKSAKAIISYAMQFNSPIIVFEDLDGIRESIGRRSTKINRQFHSWPFRVLRISIESLAEINGIPIAHVDPMYTSQTCPRCAKVEKNNRKRDLFRCVFCGYQSNSDVVAATNIAMRWFSDVDHAEPGVKSTIRTSRIEERRAKLKSQTLVCDS